jgi:hypothetical protein
MAVTINASTTSGLIQSADTSGQINLQSNGTTVLGVTSSGSTVTGTQSVSGDLSFNSGYGSAAVAYGCRAWVNFNGTSTVAIRASGNVSSITDNGTGDYTINFSTAMTDANYTLTASAGKGSSGTDPRAVGFNQANPTTSAARITVKPVDGSAGLNDVEFVCCSIFR